jgi:hypothetical protein
MLIIALRTGKLTLGYGFTFVNMMTNGFPQTLTAVAHVVWVFGLAAGLMSGSLHIRQLRRTDKQHRRRKKDKGVTVGRLLFCATNCFSLQHSYLYDGSMISWRNAWPDLQTMQDRVLVTGALTGALGRLCSHRSFRTAGVSVPPYPTKDTKPARYHLNWPTAPLVLMGPLAPYGLL